ncbi:hypothetical protein B4N89_36825 [Embleya scabrispora]|uniref:Insertion element IS402-like domain-containing protein n=1 Tax=Embleya scabrispora TaxID=159449 RepID=A0A1T3NLW9_9ACTN|nr:hypothetical protein B4N89_36825 [Embleya scabrispora]
MWFPFEPLLPEPAPEAVPGSPRVPDRRALCGIQWEFLPSELGFGSGMTCWRRLEAWNGGGVWDRPYAILLARLYAAEQFDRSRAVIDSSHVRAAQRRGSMEFLLERRLFGFLLREVPGLLEQSPE